jgi:serine/threonine-protein kinase
MTLSLDDCRALERAGQRLEAYRAYLAHDFVEEAARLLSESGRDVDAAEVLLSWVTRRPLPLDTRARACGLQAAHLLEAHGRGARALELLAWLQDAEALTVAALRIGAAGAPFPAACALARHGRPDAALPWLSDVRHDDARYAGACVEAARALARGACLTMRVDRWLADFIRRGPQTEDEAEAFYALAAVYDAAGFPESAEELLRRLVQSRPGYRDATLLRERMTATLRGTPEQLARVVAEDAAFAGAASLRRPPTPGPADIVAAEALDGSAAGVGQGPGNPEADTVVGEPLREAPAVVPSSSSSADRASVSGAAAAVFGSPTVLPPGTFLANRYRIVDVVGRGGMSIVYKVVDVELNETVALKLFTQTPNEEAVERFKQEVRLARQLVHDHVIRMYDMGFAAGARFLTMELLVGEDLHTKMVRGLTMREGVLLLAQACAGLDAAHRLGVVHRDVKPENLFVTNDHVVKVMDFGIARHTKNSGLTLAGMVVGTPEYMAPEQAHGHMSVTPSADLYSIGVILYALATGQLPFRHAELVPLLMMHVQQAPAAPRRLNPSCPADFEQLVLELLAKRAEQRPSSAKIVEERLKRLVHRGVFG